VAAAEQFGFQLVMVRHIQTLSEIQAIMGFNTFRQRNAGVSWFPLANGFTDRLQNLVGSISLVKFGKIGRQLGWQTSDIELNS
jgi:hypothetical protein